MKKQTRIIVISGIFGMIAWVVDAVFDYFIFYQKPFWDLLIFQVPSHEIYIRCTIFACFLAFGVIASQLVAAQEQAEGELQQAHDHLKEMVEVRTESLRKACESLRAEIEERKRVEKALLDSQMQLSQMFERSLVSKLLIDAETGAILDANPAACNFYGYTLDQLKSMTIVDISAFPREGVLDELALTAKEKRRHFCALQQLATGEQRHMEVYVCKLDLQDRPALYCIVNDMTDRKIAEEAMRESEERYRMLFDEANDSIFVVELTAEQQPGRFLQVNDMACSTTGYTREELLEKGPADLTHPEDKTDIPTIISNILEQDGTLFEIRSIRKDGWSIPLEISAHLFTMKGNPAILAIARDITERKKTEELRQESEKKLRKLSAQLMTAQERERALIAMELHDSIGQTLTAIKFTLESIIANTDSASAAPPVEELSALVPTVQSAIEEVRRICASLRPSLLDDFGILVTLSWFCREFQNTYPQIHIKKDIHLEEDEIPEHLKIVVFRIVQEALHNVVKHSRACSITLSLKKTDSRIKLDIQDNGQGFDLQELASNGDPQRGMGLAGMKERTELSGGSFAIHSARGAGTLVTASWPIP